MVRIDVLDDDGLLRAYNELAPHLGRKATTDLGERGAAETRLEALLSEASSRFSVSVDRKGKVSVEALPPMHQEPEPKPIDVATESRIVHSPSEPKISPGIARMRARLGAEGTEALRAKVVQDGEASLVAAAARPDQAGSQHDWKEGDPAPNTPPPSELLRLKELPLGELNLLLSKEMNPAMRTVIQEAMKLATQREGAAPRKATASPAPSPRKATPGGASKAPSLDSVIHLKVANGYNPKRAGAATRFACYKEGMLVAEYIAAIGGDAAKAARDLSWDASQGWIEVVPPKQG